MSKRYDLIGYCSYRDNETGKVSDNFVGLLNEQDQKIKELEHRLSNCIEPKFEQGQKCYFRWGSDISSVKVKDLIKLHYIIEEPSGYNSVVSEDQLFSTEAEAKAKLEELKK